MKKRLKVQKRFRVKAASLKKNHIKHQILGNLMFEGKKTTGEKILLKSFKELQKCSSKKSKDLIKISLVSTLPVFTTHVSINKQTKRVRESPVFINNQYARTSLAIKFILKDIRKENFSFFTKFKNIMSFGPKNSVDLKNKLQKQALIKKRYFKNFKF